MYKNKQERAPLTYRQKMEIARGRRVINKRRVKKIIITQGEL